MDPRRRDDGRKGWGKALYGLNMSQRKKRGPEQKQCSNEMNGRGYHGVGWGNDVRKNVLPLTVQKGSSRIRYTGLCAHLLLAPVWMTVRSKAIMGPVVKFLMASVFGLPIL